jgi:hypothetical protein
MQPCQAGSPSPVVSPGEGSSLSTTVTPGPPTNPWRPWFDQETSSGQVNRSGSWSWRLPTASPRPVCIGGGCAARCTSTRLASWDNSRSGCSLCWSLHTTHPLRGTAGSSNDASRVTHGAHGAFDVGPRFGGNRATGNEGETRCLLCAIASWSSCAPAVFAASLIGASISQLASAGNGDHPGLRRSNTADGRIQVSWDRAAGSAVTRHVVATSTARSMGTYTWRSGSIDPDTTHLVVNHTTAVTSASGDLTFVSVYVDRSTGIDSKTPTNWISPKPISPPSSGPQVSWPLPTFGPGEQIPARTRPGMASPSGSGQLLAGRQQSWGHHGPGGVWRPQAARGRKALAVPGPRPKDA